MEIFNRHEPSIRQVGLNVPDQLSLSEEACRLLGQPEPIKSGLVESVDPALPLSLNSPNDLREHCTTNDRESNKNDASKTDSPWWEDPAVLATLYLMLIDMLPVAQR